MEQNKTYQTVMQPEMDTAPGWGRIIDEGETDRHRNSDVEMVKTYVPEAGDLPFAVALSIAQERDRAAADALRLDFIQTATI